MKLQRFTDYLLANRLRTVLLLVAISLMPSAGVSIGVAGKALSIVYTMCITIGMMLGVLFAGFVTLRKGAFDGALMTAAVTVPTLLKFVIEMQGQGAALPSFVYWTLVSLALVWAVSNLLTWIFAILLYRQMTWSAILQVAALGGVLVVSVVHLAYPDVVDWWTVQFNHMANQVVAALPDSTDAAQFMSVMKQRAIENAKDYNGTIIGILLLSALTTLAVARWWQAALYSPGMLRRELHHIRLSNLAGVLFLISQLLAAQGNSVVLDILPILYLLFACAGLSVIHYLFGFMVSPTRGFWLALLYVVIYYTMPISLMLISIVALMDVWFDLRKRLKKSSNHLI